MKAAMIVALVLVLILVLVLVLAVLVLILILLLILVLVLVLFFLLFLVLLFVFPVLVLLLLRIFFQQLLGQGQVGAGGIAEKKHHSLIEKVFEVALGDGGFIHVVADRAVHLGIAQNTGLVDQPHVVFHTLRVRVAGIRGRPRDGQR